MLYVDGNPNIDKIKSTRLRTVDDSISSKLLGCFHNFVLRRTALWISPSVFTVVSLVLTTSYFFTALRHGAFDAAEYPPWMYATNAFVIFFMLFSSALDEKQVRRTGRSAPLSEFLRNGYTLVLTISALKDPLNTTFLNIFWLGYAAYFLTLWATYLTGRLTHFYVGVREVHLLAVAVNLFVAYNGPQFEPGLAKWFELASGLLFLAQAGYSLFRGVRASLELENIEIVAGFFLGLPVFWIIFTSYSWLNQSSVQNHALPFTLLLTTLFTYVNARLVFARICQFASDIFYFVLVPLSVAAFFPSFYEYFGFRDDRSFVFAYLSVSLLYLVHFVWSVVDFYVNYCDGQLFQVEPVKRQRQPKKAQQELPVDSLFEDDPEDEEFEPSSEGEDEEDQIEPEEDRLEEAEVEQTEKDAQTN